MQARQVLVVAALNAVGHHVVQYAMATRPADDIRDTERLLGILNSEEIGTVFHLAAQPFVPESLRDPVKTWSINADGTISVLEALRRSCATKRLIFASSRAFDGKTREPIFRGPTPEGGPRRKSLDIRKAASLLSSKPEIETQRGIRELF